MSATDVDELIRQVESRLKVKAPVTGEPLRWAMALPVWTHALATALRWPGGVEALQALAAQRLCDAHEEEGVLLYAVRPSVRESHLKNSAGEVRALTLTLAGELPAEGVPTATRLWADLVRDGEPHRALRSQVDRLLDQARKVPRGQQEIADRLASSAILAEVLGLIRTAADLELVFGPTQLHPEIEAATRKLEFFQLGGEDERRLASYVVRQEQLEAFRRLREPHGPWALHFVGRGGMGKTMLARYLCAREIPEQGDAWARVDFDHLDPAYPSREPWLLLDRLGDQLRLQDPDGRVNKELQVYEDRRLSVRELTSVASWRDVQENSLWKDLVAAFGRGLAQLPKLVFLVFDTCEELAKIETGLVPPNVAATFNVLETLQQQCDRLRVVFMGRRPLASAGFGWATRDQSSLPPRPYLALHEVQGFHRPEAIACFAHIAERNGDLIDAVLERSAEADHPSRFQAQAAPADQRYAPFEVVLYAQWARQDRAVTAADIRSADVDRYIEMRIVERTRDPFVRRMLPAAGLLRRFDRALLDAVIPPAPGEDRNATFQALMAFDWMSQERDFFAPSASIGGRMERFYEKRAPREMESLRKSAIAALRVRTLADHVSRTPRFLYVRLAGLLREEPAALHAWWLEVEAAIARPPGFRYADAVEVLCTELLADDGPLQKPGRERPRETIARVFAMLASARLHRGADRRTPLQQALAENPSDPALIRRLRWCLLTPGEWPSSDEPLDREGAPAWIAAAEAAIEQAEADPTGAARVPTFIVPPDELAHDPVLSAVAASLSMRSFALAGAGAAAMEQAHNSLRGDVGKNVGQQWSDWRAPDDLAERLCLEAARALYGRVPPQAVLELISPWQELQPLSGIDGDRLASVRVQLLGAWLPPPEVMRERGVGSPDETAPQCLAHREVPPWSVSYAAALGESGRLRDAFELLDVHAHLEAGFSQTVTSRRSGGALQWRLARLMSDAGQRGALPPPDFFASANYEPEEAAEYWPLYFERTGFGAAFGWVETSRAYQSRSDQTPGGCEVHAVWRGIPLHDKGDAQRATEWLWKAARDETVDLLLDKWEAQLVRERFGLGALTKDDLAGRIGRLVDRLRPAQAASRRLRFEALAGRSPPPAWIETIGPRRVAWLALDEGELIARRLPEVADRLLKLAAALSERTQDTIGALLAQVLGAPAPADDPNWQARAEAIRALMARKPDLRQVPGLQARIDGLLVAPVKPTFIENVRGYVGKAFGAVAAAAKRETTPRFAFEALQIPDPRGFAVEIHRHGGSIGSVHLETDLTYSDLAERLRPLLPLSTGGPINFAVSSGAAGICWEAALSRRWPEGDFRRGSSAAPAAAPSRAAVARAGLVSSGGSRGIPFEDLNELGVPIESMSVDARQLLSSTLPVDLLHVLGKPVRTSRGLRIELFGGSSSSKRTTRAESVDAASIVSAGKNMRFCILQVPGIWEPSRTTSDRYAANELREFAAQVAAGHGLSAVVCIPLLPRDLARQVAANLLRAFAFDWAIGLPRQVQDARSAIVESLNVRKELAMETALDVALYMPPLAEGSR